MSDSILKLLELLSEERQRYDVLFKKYEELLRAKPSFEKYEPQDGYYGDGKDVELGVTVFGDPVVLKATDED